MALFLVFTSCSGDDDASPVTPEDTEATITAIVDGEEWTGTITSATVIKYASLGKQRFDISAEGDGKRIFIACESELQAGMPLQAYTFSENEGNALFLNYYMVGNNSYSVHMPETGTVTMTSFNSETKKASGTFSFSNSKTGDIEGMEIPENFVVTGGVFTNVKYTEYNQ